MEAAKLGELVALLASGDEKAGYVALKRLLALSEASAEAYPYMDCFADMLKDETNAYVRMRAFALVAANARWDVDYKVDQCLDELLKHVADSKPIAARKCIQALPQIALSKPELRGQIAYALQNADTARYADSMRPLIEKDIRNALKAIEMETE